MSFRLDEVDLEKDFDELMECQWAAHEDPPQPFFRLFCPILDDDRETSIKESTTRFLEWHRHEPEAIWLKVTDSISGKIVGGAWYKIYNDNPFKHHEDECVDWYPNDSTRDYVSQAITILDRPRMEKARRPQVCEFEVKRYTPVQHLADKAQSSIFFSHIQSIEEEGSVPHCSCGAWKQRKDRI